MTTRFHIQASEIISHQLRTKITSLCEELSKDFPSLPREELLILISRNLLSYSYASMGAVFRDNETALLIFMRALETEHKHYAENYPEWNRHSQNSTRNVSLMESLLKAFNGYGQKT